MDDKFTKLRSQLTTFAGLITGQFDKLRAQGIRFEYESNLFELLKGQGLEISTVNGIAHIIDFKEKVVEVPVQDARTKHLVHLLAVQLKKYVEKYPKLREECDGRLTEFFQQ